MAIVRIYIDAPRMKWLTWKLVRMAVICFVIGFVLGSIFHKNDLRATSELAQQMPHLASHLPTVATKFREHVACGDLIDRSGDHQNYEITISLTEGCWTTFAHPVSWAQFSKEWDGGEKGDWVVFQPEGDPHLFGPISYPDTLPDLGLYYRVKLQGRGKIRFLRGQ